MLFYSNMQTANSFTPLTPTEAIERYSRELTFTDPSDGNRVVIRPALIGTLFFERGSQPDVRKGTLDCVDRFRAMFGERLEDGKNGETKYSRKTAKGAPVCLQWDCHCRRKRRGSSGSGPGSNGPAVAQVLTSTTSVARAWPSAAWMYAKASR